jgi:hypothetical protein
VTDTQPTGLTVQQADALWDAVAIPGPHTPTFPEQHERVCRAVAGILAELPPPADRAEYIEAEVQRLVNIRAAVLREAADGFDRHAKQILDGVGDKAVFVAKALRDQAAVWSEAAETLRRMAGEAQPSEAHPAERKWAAELYDPLAEQWVPGTRYADRDRAVNALAHGKRVGPAWKDGTPTERRLVRATTTYTVEAEHTDAEKPAAPRREPHPTEADVRHALAVAAKFHSQKTDGQTDEDPEP